MKVEGKTHSEHTSDEHGHFKHPFLNADPEVQTIHYPESGSFSTKLHRVEGVSRLGRGGDGRSITKGGVQKK